MNELTSEERASGWRLLFDGRTTVGWRGFRRESVPSGWQVVDSALTRVEGGGDIISVDQFENFDLVLEWTVEAGGNSEVLSHLVQMSKPSAKVVHLGLPGLTASDGSKNASIHDLDDGKVIDVSLGGQPADWKAAIRLVRTRTVSLDDHTAVVRPLEAYKEAWASLKTGKYFKVLLSASKDLEAL